MFDYQRDNDGPWFRFRDRKSVEVSLKVKTSNQSQYYVILLHSDLAHITITSKTISVPQLKAEFGVYYIKYAAILKGQDLFSL